MLEASAQVRGVAASETKPFTVNVPALSAEDVTADADDLVVPETTLGNLYLPQKGNAGTPIAWTSSQPEVISDELVGSAAPGVVNRPDWGSPDIDVVLTATVGFGDQAEVRVFETSVAALPREAEDERYLFAYFTQTRWMGSASVWQPHKKTAR